MALDHLRHPCKAERLRHGLRAPAAADGCAIGLGTQTPAGGENLMVSMVSIMEIMWNIMWKDRFMMIFDDLSLFIDDFMMI